MLVLLALPTAEVIEYFGLEGWAQTLAMLPAMVIATLFDRDYFYPRPPGAPRR